MGAACLYVVFTGGSTRRSIFMFGYFNVYLVMIDSLIDYPFIETKLWGPVSPFLIFNLLKVVG